jgi:hypothetical protein
MAKKTTKLRPWTKEDVRTMRALAREKVKTSVIARKLKRSIGATYQQASKHGVTLGASQRKRKDNGTGRQNVAEGKMTAQP